MYDLEKGMKAVADGDFTHRLPTIESRHDEFGRLAESYQRMTSQLAELDKLKAEFVSVASHELKTPINVIVGYLELLQENIYGELNPKQREMLMDIVNAYSSQMTGEIALLRMSRLQKAGVEKIAFAWAGEVVAGKKHYYRVQGPTVLIEYDNTQNDANHVHSVWRDFDGDFGRDLLREHVQRGH